MNHYDFSFLTPQFIILLIINITNSNIKITYGYAAMLHYKKIN